jgi:hypothetical protein
MRAGTRLPAPGAGLTVEDMLGGVLMLGLITAGVVGAVWCVFNGSRLLSWLVAAGRSLRLLPPAPPVPLGMPIERIVSDLRRIRPQARTPVAGMPMARRRGLVAAYDDALLDACRALGVPTALDSVSDDLERESERLRTEHELARAGLDLG